MSILNLPFSTITVALLLAGCGDKSNETKVAEAISSRTSLDPKARANPQYIIDAKNGHLKTCSETIQKQVKSVGAGVSNDEVRNYCGCLGNFYFNDLTNAELDQIMRGALPERIEANRTNIQQHCASLHLPEISS